MKRPTAEGLRRFPLTGGFHPDLGREGAHPDHDLPCTCETSCHARCAGECGCVACEAAFVEFCDIAGFLGLDGPHATEAALAAYRDVPVHLPPA